MNSDVMARLKKQSGSFRKKTESVPKPAAGNIVLQAEVIGDFNLTDNEGLNKYLLEKSIELQTLQAKTSLSLGKVFEEVFQKLGGKNQHDGTYVAWLEGNGFNRMTALRHRRRHQMYTLVNSDKGKAFVATLPVKVIDSVYRHNDFSGIISIIDDGITREELEVMLVPTPVIDIPVYNPKETEKVYKSVSKLWRAVSLEKVSDENAESFEKDMKKVERILSKWQEEKEEEGK
ncbi:hypothetical protein PM10SUCC1_32170 [Propionigenium maris DSM 9537]|uniref:Uncharacterized protein n=1 Tax=Propionigenium maris DSM 9537 TaxID=1123000 RepID=A0A9W6GNC1_9FUSO|nr:hypothetical protein [Propionigenium maris]GLI57703.1 hypothetical protein PM10SUCC1_32170 [Propionigenium maris DSM 9537]